MNQLKIFSVLAAGTYFITLLSCAVKSNKAAVPGSRVSAGHVYGNFEESDFCKALQPGKRILELEGWHVWCASPILDEDGKVHVFFSRWRGSHNNWISDCEIAHAVADKPEGPYKVTGTVLKGRGENYWDANTVHNPTVQKIGNKYAMFYISNKLSDTSKYDGHPASTQRIGLAIADSLNGEWKRVGNGPVLDINPDRKAWDSYITTNPALLQNKDGKFWLYYKAWDKYNDGFRKMGLAVADKLEGPYEKYAGNPIVNFAPLKKQVEDAYVFCYQNKYYMVMRDMGIIHPNVGLLLESTDGLHWSEPKLGYNKSSYYFKESAQRFERPQVLMIKGRPAYLFLALQGGRYGTSSAAVLKIDQSKF